MIYINDFSRGFELSLNELCKASPYGARILAYHNAYYGKKFDFLDFWVQKNDNGRGMCAFCRYYDTMIICGKCENKSEIINFIMMVNPVNILCEGTFDLFPFKICNKGETMKFSDNKLQYTDCFDIIRIGSNMKRLQAVYNLLIAENPQTDSIPDFESYFLDISHRIRHGVSDVYAVIDNSGEIIATSTIIAKSDDCAVIGCVATSYNYRRRGIATNLVGKLTQIMTKSGREVYLHRERKIKLYDNLGYKVVGEWREYSIV